MHLCQSTGHGSDHSCGGGCAGWASTSARAAVSVSEAPTDSAAAAAIAPAEAHGFELVRQQFVHEYDSQVMTYRHKKTGG